MEDDIKQMEKAAMRAYAKDIQNNADLTSQVFSNTKYKIIIKLKMIFWL